MDARVDIVVLGATGYTGKHAAKNLALLTKQTEYKDIRWGIAGRSKEKLKNLITELEELDVDISKIAVIECDINKEEALPEATRKAKVVMNATGPNTLLSEPVVKACIQTGTHYVDISAELFHMLTLYKTYHKAAEDANVLIVPACGFDCIPSLAGLIYLEKQFTGILSFVESYNVLDIPTRAYFPGCNNCLLHYGTWESMIHEMQNYKQYSKLKKETFPETEPLPNGLQKRFFHRLDGRFWCPYPGPDRDVAEMYQRYQKENGKKSYHFKNYITLPLFIHFFFIVPAFFVFYLMSHFAWLRKLLWRYPRLFTLGYVSHEGPTEEMRKKLMYSFTITGKGWTDGTDMKTAPDKTLTVKVSGSDPAYRTTAIAFIFSAITILTERSRIRIGGVLTSGAAFNDTNLVERLIENGIKFEVIENKTVKYGKYIVEKL